LFKLPSSLGRQIEELAEELRALRAALGNVEGTALDEFPDFEVWKVELERACSRRNLEIQMVSARYKGAGADPSGAFRTCSGPRRRLRPIGEIWNRFIVAAATFEPLGAQGTSLHQAFALGAFIRFLPKPPSRNDPARNDSGEHRHFRQAI